MAIRIRDDGDVEPGPFYVENGEADTVEANGAFFDDEVAEFFWEFEAVFPTAVELFAVDAGCGGIDVALNDVSVEAAVHHQASFEVDEVAGLPGAQIGFFEGFFDSGDAVEVVLCFFDGEADAVMGDALVDRQFMANGGGDPECLVAAVGLGGADLAEGFDNSGKHKVRISHFISGFGNLAYICSPIVNYKKDMLIIDSKDCENIDKALKKYKKKFEKAKVLVQLRERQSYTKPSVRRRGEVLRAIYKQQVAAGKFE